MKPILIGWFLAVSPLAAIPANTTLTLVNEPTFNRITVTVNPGLGLADTETTTLTGTAGANFNIDPQAGTTTELTLINGRANGTNMTFSKSNFLAGYSISITNLSTALNTILPPGTVTPATGQFAASQHRFDIDQGTITGNTSGLIGNNPINESFTPESPASGTGTGNGSVILTPAGNSGIYRTFAVTVTMPVSITDSFVTGSITVNVTATGTLKASGTVQVPRTEYLAWTVNQSIAGAAFDGDPDGDGVANGILWALGLTADADPRPYLPRPDPSVPKGFVIPLPPAGTASAIQVESSTRLGAWSPLSGSQLSTGIHPLPAGSSGNVRVLPDATPRRFVRLKVSEP